MNRLAVVVVLAACGGSSPRPEPTPHQPPRPPADRAEFAPHVPAANVGLALAEVRPVKNVYHGVTVTDPYQWLEGETPEVTAWSNARDAYARSFLDKLPDAGALHAEIERIVRAPITQTFDLKPAGGNLFARRKNPTKEQAEIVVFTDPEHPEAAKLVFDPIAEHGHEHRSVDWFVPSPDGKKLAIAASDGGSEIADVHVIGLDGKELEPPIPNVQRATAGGDVAWTPDSKGLYYTRYPAPGEKPDTERDFWQQVWFHTLGTPIAKDRLELGKDFPKNAEILLDVDPHGRVLAAVQAGDGGTFRHYLRDARGTWKMIDDWDDQVVAVVFGPSANLWAVSRKGAPRGKIVKLSATGATPTVVVPEGGDSIITDFYSEQALTVRNDRLYVAYQLGGPSELRAFSLTGKPLPAPAGPPISHVTKPVVWQDDLLVQYTSYTTPWTWFRYVTKTGKLVELTAMSPRPPVDLSKIQVRREMATSKDGTQVPLNIAWPEGAPQDGSVPCIAIGYGGFNISEEPAQLLTWAPLLSRGTCIVTVNLRGGGEFGEDWHRAGMLLAKQNVFDDFAAALQYLVDKKYTSSAHLGILGGSNGGLLMGAMITQHPSLVKAVVSGVGIYDMLRSELTPNGAFVTSEYGSVADKDQFKALYAYSPYHHVVAGTKFPAILMMTGANDGRVAPWQSRKMIAALEAAARGQGGPILLRTSTTAGHGHGTNLSERIDQVTAQLAFLIAQLR